MAKRLIESSESQALRDALGEARKALGSEHDLRRLREKLGELPAVAAPGEASAVASSTGAKVAVIGAASVLILGAAMMLASREPAAPAPSQPAPPIIRAPEPPAAAAPAPAPEIAPPVQPDPLPQSTPAPRKVAPRAKAPAVAKAEPAPTPAPTAPKELELLTSAQDAMEAAPQRALGLLEQHAELYPNGSFAIERESLAIDALRKLGRVTAAQKRARAFIARFPKAPNVKHLRRWLDEGAAIDHKEPTEPLPTP